MATATAHWTRKVGGNPVAWFFAATIMGWLIWLALLAWSECQNGSFCSTASKFHSSASLGDTVLLYCAVISTSSIGEPKLRVRASAVSTLAAFSPSQGQAYTQPRAQPAEREKNVTAAGSNHAQLNSASLVRPASKWRGVRCGAVQRASRGSRLCVNAAGTRSN